MTLPEIVSREQLAVRAQRAARPGEGADPRRATRSTPTGAGCRWCEVDKDYVFEGPDGPSGLRDLFGGARQLVVQHFMFDPSWDAGCPSCSAGLDEMSAGLLTTCTPATRRSLSVSRAPFAKLDAYRASAGWTFPWYSSFGSDFNYDFHVTPRRVGRACAVQLPRRRRAARGRPRLGDRAAASSSRV